MNQYQRIMELVKEKLYGYDSSLPHREIINLVHEVLIQVADEKLADMAVRAFEIKEERRNAKLNTASGDDGPA